MYVAIFVDHEMHPYRKKAACKSRPGHLDSSAWCLWIVHECDFYLQRHRTGLQLNSGNECT